MRFNIARLSAATYTGIVQYMQMPLWQLVQVMEDVEKSNQKKR